jgi:hypothetical protein
VQGLPRRDGFPRAVVPDELDDAFGDGHRAGRHGLLDAKHRTDDANHAEEGIFIWQGRGKAAASGSDKVSIYDIAPSILDFYGIDTPPEMIGKVL